MKKILLTLIAVIAISLCSSAQVGIGTTTPEPSAILDVSSTTHGLLLPRMTTVQRDAITTPATGLFVYNLDTDCLNIFDGILWKELCGL